MHDGAGGLEHTSGKPRGRKHASPATALHGPVRVAIPTTRICFKNASEDLLRIETFE